MYRRLLIVAFFVLAAAGSASALPTWNGVLDFYDGNGEHIGNADVVCDVGVFLNWGSTSEYVLNTAPTSCENVPIPCDEVGAVEVGPCGACGSWQYEQLYLLELVDPCD